MSAQTDHISSHIRNVKRSYQQLSPLPTPPAKKSRPGCDLQQFTEEEELILKGAAKILKVPLKSLLAIVKILLPPGSVQLPTAEVDRTQFRWDPDCQTKTAERINSYYPHQNARMNSRDPNPVLNSTTPAADSFTAFDPPFQSDAVSFPPEWAHESSHVDIMRNYGPPVEHNVPIWHTFTDPTAADLPLDGFENLSSASHASSITQETASRSSNATPESLHAQTEPRHASTLPTSPFLGPSWAEWTDSAPSHFTDVGDHDQEFTGITDNSNKKRQRGPFRDHAQRIETSVTRKNGACVSCKMQRIRCVPDPKNPEGCCRTSSCIQATRRRLPYFPCLRYNLSEAELLDHGKCPRPSWTRRWPKMEIVDIRTWESPETKTIRITQDVEGKSYPVEVRRFVLKDGDASGRRWKFRGVDRFYDCEPWAIADMRGTGRTLSEFADQTLESAIRYYIGDSDPLLKNTYQMAYKYSKAAERQEERALLRAALRLWNASRMESRSDRICSDETLGMEPQDYGAEDPNTGKILTHPVFSAQLEVIVVASILKPAKRDLLKRLGNLIQEQRQSWFAVYLSMFILLHSCALLTASANKKARKQGLQSRYFHTPIVESLHNGAKILLAYFHFCNRGSYPFTMDWSSPDQIAQIGMNAEQVAFMQETCREIEKKASLFQNIRKNGDFEHDYYFLSDLFERDWRPRHTI